MGRHFAVRISPSAKYAPNARKVVTVPNVNAGC
jgi:hypothetical protein